MAKITVELEAVTATFLHVEPRGSARWRAAPFRGLTRWWYRAVAGGAQDADQVRRSEAGLFGTAEEPSKVVFRVFRSGEPRLGDADINPGSKKTAKSAALLPGSRVTLELCPSAFGTDADVGQAYAALWVAVHLGGIGQRSRRGAGSLAMTSVQGAIDVPGPLVVTETTSAASYAGGLRTGLERARTLLGASNVRRITDKPPEFPILHSKHCWVYVADGSGGNEADQRLHVMANRRFHHHKPLGKGEYEFGGIGPRLSSPTWVRVAATSPRAVFVGTVFRYHLPDGMAATWAKAEQFLKALGEGSTVFGEASL